jgi:multiple sugar transport system ATP-binding protein
VTRVPAGQALLTPAPGGFPRGSAQSDAAGGKPNAPSRGDVVTLKVTNLSKHYGDVRAVDHINLSVADGEFLVLLGASGSGKTTLMRVIAGLEEPTEGEIYIAGRLANDLAPRTRNIAMVFQSYALYPHKTVFKNIAFPLEAIKTPERDIRARAQWAAELLGIGHLMNRKPQALSGGERQRVALARALVREPTLFLMDEPLSNLDAKLRLSARRQLKRLHDEARVTTIYVTHDQVEAMSLGHRIAVMNHGRIEQVGTPQDLYQEPVNTFVAQFMGSPAMNLIRRGDVLMGFRPEDFQPTDGAVNEDVERLTFQLQLLEDLGPEALLYGFVKEDETAPEPAEVIVKVPAAQARRLGEQKEYPFVVERHLLHRFDPRSGRRLGSSHGDTCA